MPPPALPATDRPILSCPRCPGAEHAEHGWTRLGGDQYHCPGVDTVLDAEPVAVDQEVPR